MEDFPGASTGTPVRTPLNATGTLQRRQDRFSTYVTSMGNHMPLTKSFGMVQVSKGTAERIPMQILKKPNKLYTKIADRICDTEILPCISPHPPPGTEKGPNLLFLQNFSGQGRGGAKGGCPHFS